MQVLLVLLLTLAFTTCKSNNRDLNLSEVKSSNSAPFAEVIASESEFHEDISNDRRIQLLSNVRVGDIMSAPGHAHLREPGKVLSLADHIHKTGGSGFEREPIVLGVFTANEGSSVRVRSVEVIDGNHRLAAGLYSGKWKTVGNIPKNFLKVLVNGWPAGGTQSNPRWIPLEVAEKSSIPKDQWVRVPDSWGPKSPSAQIPGTIASIDNEIPAEFRGVPMKQVLVISLKRISATIPAWLN